jgi:DNA-binding CsgD family transcriptional regulator
VVDEIEEFVTGARPEPDYDRVLATILFARLAMPARIARFGDRHWSGLVERLRRDAGEIVGRFRGQPMPAGPEEMAARFDGPARAVRCALALREAATALDLALSAGVHAGEIALREDAPAGIALHVAQHIAGLAATNQVLASAVVADLAVGSGLHFVDHATVEIVGLEGPVRIVAIMVEEHLEPALRAAKTPKLAALTEREREVLALVAEGLSNGAIAGRLRLSEHTVKRHVANILLKLDLPTRTAAAALAASEGSL